MPIDEVDDIMNQFEKWDLKEAKRGFIHKMERKLNRKLRADQA